jgi:hypothetical protein
MGVCYPSRKTLAALCGYKSTRSVTRNITVLEEDGLLEKNPRYRATSKGPESEARFRQTTNEYRLKLEVPGEALDGACSAPGDSGVTGGESGQSALPLDTGVPPNEPSDKEPNKEPDTAARQVYDHWLNVCSPTRPPEFGNAVIKQIAKGLALYSADDLCLAFDGLAEWRKRKPGKMGLGAVLDTYPGGKPLHEQIGFFISQAKGATPGGGKYPSAPKAIIAEHQRWVLRGHRLTDNAEAVKRAKESEVWLFERGIVCQAGVSPDEGQPTFRARRDGDEFRELPIIGARS